MSGTFNKTDSEDLVELPLNSETPKSRAERALALQDPDNFDPVKYAVDYVFGSEDTASGDAGGVVERVVPPEVKESFKKLLEACRLKTISDFTPYLNAVERIIDNIKNNRKMRIYAVIATCTMNAILNFKNKSINACYTFLFILDCVELEVNNIFVRCFLFAPNEIKMGVFDIIKTLCYTEPDCKDLLSNSQLIGELVYFCREDDEAYRSKAIDALIAIISRNSKGIELMRYHCGYSLLLSSLMKDTEELSIKILSFFIDACSFDAQIRLYLISMEYMPACVTLLSRERKRSHYYLMELLLILVEQNYDPFDEMAKSRLDVKEVLNGILRSNADKPELREERRICLRLLRAINDLEVGRSLYDRAYRG